MLLGRYRPTLLHLALAVPWVGLVLGVRRPVRDNSYLWHVAAGDLQLTLGQVLTTDPFSYTQGGSPWRTQSWLAELLYAFLDRWCGVASVPWIIMLFAGGALLTTMVTAFRKTGSLFVVAVIGVLGTWIGTIYLNPRPVVLSYLLMALVVMVFGAPKLRWSLPLLIWGWAALHGSFVIGIGLIVLARWSQRDWLNGVRWGLGLSAVASMTAHGWGVWEMLLAFYRARPALDLISEWAPPDFVSLGLIPFLMGIGLLLVAAMRGGIRGPDLVIIGPLLLLAFSASRSVYPAWLALSPYVAAGIGAASAIELRLPPRSLNLAVLPLLILGPFFIQADSGVDKERFPIDASACIDPTRRVFHNDVVGGYLIYSNPHIPVFVDDRAELYGEQIFRDVLEMRNGGRGWQRVVDSYAFSQVLVDVDAAVVDDLVTDGWFVRFEDDYWILLDVSEESSLCG